MFRKEHDQIRPKAAIRAMDGSERVEDEAFSVLFTTYKNRLFGYVLAITHSKYIAEEITQEIFIKLWLCRDILHQVDNLDGYIFTVARNKTLNHLRKAAHDMKLLRDLQVLGNPDKSNNNVEERALVTEYDKLLRDALTLLSPQRRLVYQLSRHKGLNHEEIAHQLQLSRHTVKNHMVEALRFIRVYLGKHGSTILLLAAFLVQ
jgi:RNA polymerase sigma-70 factor (ECF subfamily)